jgi:prophage DNA circulation protein
MEYLAKINDYFLDVESIPETHEFSIPRHEYVYSQKNTLEHLGAKTPAYTITCSFQDNPAVTEGWSLDEGFYPTWEAHKLLLGELKSNLDIVTFTHPMHGEMKGRVESFNVLYDEVKPHFATVTIVFLQQITDDTLTFVQYIVPENARKFRETSSRMKTILENAQKYADNADEWAHEAANFRSTLQAHLNDITSPGTSIANTISYGATLPGLVLQDINMAVDRVIQSFVDIAETPVTLINSFIVELRRLKSLFTGSESEWVHVMAASRLSYDSAVQLEADEENIVNIINQENKSSFDAAGNFKGSLSTVPDVMTIDELDKITAEIKTFINEAIQIDRENPELVDQAASIQKFVNNVRLTRERIVTKTYNDQPLHAILLKEKLSYQVAERILKLNPWIINPMFVSGDVKLIIPAANIE